MKLIDCGPKVSEQEIQAFSRKFGIVLTKQYVDFLVKHNGGRPEPKCYVSSDQVEFGVHEFLSFETSGEDQPGLKSSYILMDDCIPDELIPIATNGAGNYVCLGVKGEYIGKVFAYFKEEYESEDGPTFENVQLLEESFDDFIRQFRDTP